MTKNVVSVDEKLGFLKSKSCYRSEIVCLGEPLACIRNIFDNRQSNEVTVIDERIDSTRISRGIVRRLIDSYD